ncbi:HAD-IA family hydrolase [Jannaschia sp. KMU-145]|uniref:HAD-IA family hydrolase n=1 Tax=Jannaschia halovivens TaxID=3388667 RepID=UPI00396B234F
MKRSVIFDLDGTLCDTSGDLLAAANVAFADLGRDVRLDAGAPEDRATALRGARAMLRLGLGRLGDVDEGEVDAGFQPLLDAYARDIARHTVFYPGALDAVTRLREGGDAVAICTNKPEGLARQLMDALDASHHFDALLGADTLPVRKPDPRHLTETVAAVGGTPSRAVLIGDTQTDRDTAKAAGVPCILVTFGPGSNDVADLAPEALLHDYGQLEDALRLVGL